MLLKTFKFSLKTIFVFSIITLILAFVYSWFISAPRSLEQFKPAVEQALNEAIKPYQSNIGKMQLNWSGWQQVPFIEVIDFAIFSEEDTVFKTEHAEVSLSLSNLLQTKINPISVLLENSTIIIPEDQNSDSANSLFSDIFYENLNKLEKEVAVEKIDIINTKISFNDKSIIIEKLVSNIQREDSILILNSSMDFLFSGEQSQLQSEFSYSALDSTINGQLFIQNINPTQVADYMPGLILLKSFDAPSNISLNWRISNRLNLDQVELKIESKPGKTTVLDLFPEPLSFNSFELSANIYDNASQIKDIILTIDFEELNVAASADILYKGSFPLVEANIELKRVTFDNLVKYWPPDLESATRAWLTTNLSTGSVPKLNAYLYLTPDVLKSGTLLRESIDIQFTFENLTANYYDILSPLKKAKGSGRLTGKSLDINVSEAFFRASLVDSGIVNLSGIGEEIKTLQLRTFLNGPVRNISDALGALGAFNDSTFILDIRNGRAQSFLSMQFPLNRKLQLKEYNIVGQVAVNDFKIRNLYGLDLEKGSINLTLQAGKIYSTGYALIDGLPVELSWQQDISKENTNPRIFKFKSDLSNFELTRFGVPALTGFQGRSNIDLTLQVYDSLLNFNSTIDLKNNAYKIRYLGWNKAAGDNATMTIKGYRLPGDSTLYFEDFTLTANDIFARGNGVIELGGRGYDILVENLTYDKNDFSAKFESDPVNGLNIKLDGESIDFQETIVNELYNGDSLITSKISTTTDSPGIALPINISINSAQANLLNNISIKKLRSNLSFYQGELVSADIKSRLSGKRLQMLFDPEKKENNIQIKTADGGALLKGFNIYSHINGGDLIFNGQAAGTLPGDPMEATLVLTNYSLKEAPTLTKMLSLAAMLGEAGLLKNNGIPFKRLDAELFMENKILYVKNSKMAGSALYLSSQGSIDLNASQMDLQGTLYPFTTVNNILSYIPIIGNVAKDVTILGTSYDLKGSYDDATVNVNTLSILLPAFVRDFGDLLVKDEIDTLRNE